MKDFFEIGDYRPDPWAGQSILNELPNASAFSREARRLMARLEQVTLRQDGRSEPLGRHVLVTATSIHQQSDGADFGLVTCLLVAGLVATVPSVGDDLGVFVPALLMTFGLTLGLIRSAADDRLAAMVDDATVRLRDQLMPVSA